MSLQAKIEAVIYASEEPVTLAQLVGLLGVEAQMELDALEAAQEPLLPLPPVSWEAASTLAEPPEPLLESTGEESASVAETQPTAIAPTPSADAVGKREARERERRLREYFRGLVDGLIKDYAEGDRGLEIREVAGGFRFSTKPEYHDTVRGFVRALKPPLKLSLQALETLAVVAYKQPVTAPEVSEIRGVDSGGVLGSLIARKLVTTAGRKQVIGRPILYKTTKEFLLRFGLKDTAELPSIEEFERMAGELNQVVQEEIDMEQEAQETHPAMAQPPTDSAEAPEESARSLSESGQQTDQEVNQETDQDRLEARAEDAEPMRDVHEAQADGTPDSST